MVPQSVQKVSPPSTQQSGVRGCWPQKSFKYFTCDRSHLMCQEARHICKNPRGQLAGCPAEHVVQWDGRKSSELQTVNSSLASSSTNHTGFPHGAKAKEEYLTNDVCSLHSKEAIFLSPGSRKNDLKFTKLTDPSTQERSGVWDWPSLPVTMFGISTPFMPQDSHT